MKGNRSGRTCAFIKPNGRPCGAAPLQEDTHCFWHSPSTEQEAAEARRLGGLRRKRERTFAGAYGLEGLDSVSEVRRILQVALVDTVALDNSVARNRTLTAIAMAGLKALETGELEERVEALEATLKHRAPPTPIFGVEEA